MIIFRNKYRHGFFSGRFCAAFILLEVIISMMIISIAIAALLRSFTVSLASARKTQIVTTACLLAQQILEEYEVVPPQGDHDEGKFDSPDSDEAWEVDGSAYNKRNPFRFYYWTVDVVEEEIDYPDVSFEGEIEEFENLLKLIVTIRYDDGRLKKFTPVKIETYLTTAEKFTYSSKKDNNLY
jgi:type II secretory pathway pseudopilin PulG